ncbi:hypothetical protein [Arthrobacter sp. UYEF21]|uniref:hypothetical protein n=1 Tax=Arthrobacter sp. UYEF21 TaxID=1756364 RepID=UPI003396E464
MDFVQRTIDIARANVETVGRPFATVIARDEEIIAESPNRVSQTNDPPRTPRSSRSARPEPGSVPST